MSEKVTPRYVTAQCEIGAVFLQGADINAHLKGCKQVLVFAVTLGLQVDELIRSAEVSDMAGAVILDRFASDFAEQLCDQVQAELAAKHGELTTRFSPGYGDFPLAAQHDILKLLNAGKAIGLFATDSGVLIPGKSVTAVVGIINNE